jgi:hypothetical protein
MFLFFSYWSGSVQCSECSPGSETVNDSTFIAAPVAAVHEF